MGPLSLRRYRAERLLQEEFELLRGRVLGNVRGRLRARGVSLDRSDLEECYAQAWQGLYAAMLEGGEIANPGGWLTLVTFRRAIDEHRARQRLGAVGQGLPGDAGAEPAGALDWEPAAVQERDLAAELDDRVMLRQLIEGLRGRLNAREREAAALCYLQGLTRAEAAARMGLSVARMDKLMEGHAPGRPGVARKVRMLVATIGAGGWCEEQGSLMRALAYGVLDPGGERYRLAVMHRSECPACRAYVLSLRGLAAALPPALSPLGIGHGLLAGAGAATGAGHAVVAAKGAGGGAGLGAGVGGGAGAGAGAPAGPAIGAALSASGAAGAGAGAGVGAGGAAGGGWLLAGGPFGVKLVAACLLALGIGAGCVALSVGGRRQGPGAGGLRVRPAGGVVSPARGAGSGPVPAVVAPRAAVAVPHRSSRAPVRRRAGTGVAGAGREFGPERAGAGRVVGPVAAPAPAAASSSHVPPTPRVSAAEREFSPG